MKKTFFTIAIVISFLWTGKVSAQCTADFDRNPRTVCIGEPVVFFDLSTGGNNPKTWTWNFGPGATPATFNGQNPPTVTYSTIGTKTITLTYTTNNGGCTDVQQRNVDVVTPPTVTFTSNSPQCVGSQFNFTYTGSAALTYSWNFGIGATPSSSTIQNPQGIIYSSAGTKTITLTIDNGTCVQTSTQTVTVSTTPTASFASTAPKCTGLSVDFTNTGTSSNVSYLWNFGSGASPSSSTNQNPTGVIYSTSGIKTVTLTTTENTTGCSVIATNTIDIYQTPTVNITSDAPKCENSSVTFTNNSTTGIGVSYLWDFGSGANPANSTAQNPGYVEYTGSGSKTITIVVTNEYQCSMSGTININILSKPVSNFTSMSSNCTGDSVDFQNTGTIGAAYSWTFDNGATPATSTTESPQNVVYSTSGIKTVTLITTLGTCTDTMIQTMNINQTPSPVFTHNAPQCEGSAINFVYTGTVDTNWTYLWDFGLGATPSQSSQQSVTGVEYIGGGNKVVLLTVKNGSCSEISQQVINIFSLPMVKAGKDTTICANRSVQIGALPDSNYLYSWFPYNTLNNNLISNPIASPIAYITNYVLTVTDTITGCINKDSVIVTMLPPLVANAGVDVEICRYDSIQIGAGLIEGQNYVWSPSKGLDNVNLPNPIAKPDSTTTYTLTVNGLGCENETDKVTVLVHQLPLIDAGLNDSITLGSNTQLIAIGGVQYIWSPSLGLDNIGIYNPIANPEITTTYFVNGIDIYGCKNDDSVIIYVIKPTVWIPSAFTPNSDGKNDVLYVRGEGVNNFEFAVYNSWGETVFYSKNIGIGWDGRKMATNEEMPEGAYVYYVKGVLTNGEAVNLKGIVNLVR